jgi:hypothetical protein
VRWVEVARDFIDRADRVIKVGAILSAIIAVLVYLGTGPDYALVVWIENQEAVYPSKTTAELSLPLSFRQMPVRSATFVTLNISNVGKASIGQQTEPWTLQVSGPPEATLVVLDLSALVEARTVVSQADSPAQNAIALRIRLLMPHAVIQTRLVVPNADNPPRLLATSSLVGLPQPPAVTEFSPNKLVALRLTGWLWPAFAALLAFELFGDFRRQCAELRQHRWGQAHFLAGRLLLLPFLAAFAAFAIGHGIAWLVAKAIDLGLTG